MVSLEQKEAVKYQKTKEITDPSINIYPSCRGTKYNAGTVLLDDSLNTHALQNNNRQYLKQPTVFHEINSNGHGRYHLNDVNLSQDYEKRKRRPRNSAIAFHELNYNHQKVMEKYNLQITNSKVDTQISSNSSLVENHNLVFTENENCFRITKPNSFISNNKYEGDNKQSQDNKVIFQRSNDYDLIYYPNKQKHCLTDNQIQNTTFNIDSNSVSQLTWRNDVKSQKCNYTNGILQNTTDKKYPDLKSRDTTNSFSHLTNGWNQSKINLQNDRTAKYQVLHRKPNFTLRKEGKAHHESINGKNESEDAYAKFTLGITNILQQQQLETQENERLLDFQQTNRTIENNNGPPQLLRCHNKIFIKKPLGRNLLDGNYFKYKRGNQADTRENQAITVISQSENLKPHHLKRIQCSNNAAQRNNDCRKQCFMERKGNYYSRSNFYDVQFGNRVSSQINKEFSPGINDENQAVAKLGNTNDVNALNMHYPLLYPQYFPLQMFQYWPESYLGYTNPSFDILNHQNNWWSQIQPAYRGPVQSFTEGSTLNHVPLPVPQPYNGVAGYNWPTIRKPLKSAEPEEKNDYPVYVKPPVIGSEETEQLRTAYMKYVKLLRYKLYLKSVRKQKQVERRERNFKLQISKLGKGYESDTIGSERGELETSSQNVHHCQEDSDDSQPESTNSTETNKNTFNAPSEANSWFLSSHTDSRITDIPNVVPERDFPLDTLKNKSTENHRKVADKNITNDERPFKDLVDFKTDSFEISDHDLLYGSRLCSTNQPTDYYSTRKQGRQFSTHPIYGPVCSWKEELFDKCEASNAPDNLDK